MSLKVKKYLHKIPLIFAIIYVTAIFFYMFSLLPGAHYDRCGSGYSCLSNLKQIGLALKQYAMDYDDHFPPGNNSYGLDMLRELDYLTDYGVYVCPEKKTPRGTTGPITDTICDYVYIGGFNEFDNSNTPLAFDKPGNSKDYFNVLFVDGRTERYSTPAANSCETIIIFLNEKYKYSEKLYKRLLEKAKKIDAELEK